MVPLEWHQIEYPPMEETEPFSSITNAPVPVADIIAARPP